jgi:hypothetical protein
MIKKYNLLSIALLTGVFIVVFFVNAGVAGEPITSVQGKYELETKDANANLEVNLLFDGRVHVTGLALWGTDRSAGPNIGELDFVAAIKNGLVTYEDKTGEGRPYKLELHFHQKGLTAREENALGYFGMNVTFKGEYRKK